MATDLFDITSAFIFCFFGETFLRQPKIQTAYIRLILVFCSLFIEICSLAVSFKGAILDDDVCKAMFAMIIIFLIIMLCSLCICGLAVFDSVQDDPDWAQVIMILTKFIGSSSSGFLFGYSIHLLEKYNADVLLLVFTSVDFGLDSLELIIFIIISCMQCVCNDY